MNITITINTDNDAFQESMNYETSRILEVLVKKLRRDEIDIHVGETASLLDINGNKVGKIEVTR